MMDVENADDFARIMKIGRVCRAYVIPHLVNFATLLTITLRLKQCHHIVRKT